MLKRIIRVIKVLMACSISLAVVSAIYSVVFLLSLPYSYIAEIETKGYNKADIEFALNSFNTLAQYDIFKFKPGMRPIRIEENDQVLDIMTPTDSDNRLVGLTLATPFNCKVWLRSKLTYNEMQQVVWHEVAGHCFGFGHVDYLGDLMSPVYDRIVDLANVEIWAKRVRSRIEKWKIMN